MGLHNDSGSTLTREEIKAAASKKSMSRMQITPQFYLVLWHYPDHETANPVGIYDSVRSAEEAIIAHATSKYKVVQFFDIYSYDILQYGLNKPINYQDRDNLPYAEWNHLGVFNSCREFKRL